MPRKAKGKAEAAPPANGSESVSDEVSRSSMNESHISAPDGTMPSSPMTETGSSTHEPTDFSALKEEGEFLDGDFEIHPQNSVLSTDTSRQFIKRPLNAYMIWTRHARDGILKANPHLKMNEVSKTMGEMWKKLNDEDKKPFFVMARKAAAKHKKALELNPKLAYVPSKKKVKKPEKKEEEVKEETKRSSPSPYPTPSASPITTAPRPLPPGAQPVADARTPHAYPQPSTIVRTANAHYQASPYPQPYEYRPPVQNGYHYSTPYPQSNHPAPRYAQHYTYPVNNAQSHPAQPTYPSYYPTNSHVIPNPRDPSQNLVKNPFILSYGDSGEPVYEPESPELYKDLYYKSLVQVSSKQYGAESEMLSPDFYLQRYYAVGGTDPPRRQPQIKTATNPNNGLVYQEL